jgi:hypothetical protein
MDHSSITTVAEFMTAYPDFCAASEYLHAMKDFDGTIGIDEIEGISREDLFFVLELWSDRESRAWEDLLTELAPVDVNRDALEKLLPWEITARIDEEQLQVRKQLSRIVRDRVARPAAFLGVTDLYLYIRQVYRILFHGDITPLDIQDWLETATNQRHKNILGGIFFPEQYGIH